MNYDALAAGVVKASQSFVARALAGFGERLAVAERRVQILSESVLGTPAPRDGRDGRDGKDGAKGDDGLGFDDLAVAYDGERRFVLRFTRGETVREFAFVMPVILDRGVWRDGTAYEKGDAVTWGGSVWIAQGDTGAKPDDGSGAWRLSVKRGRDGKA